MRPRFHWILCAVLLFARPAAAAPPDALRGIPDRVCAGDELHVRWDQLPGDVREVELELSLDGGRWVRVCPELDAREGGYRWRVPDVASFGARMRLRAGGQGFEVALVTSEPFTIAPARTGASAGPHTGESWELGRHRVADCWGCNPPTPSLCAGTTGCFADSQPRSPVPACGPRRSQAAFVAADGHHESFPRRPTLASTCSYPMRL